MSALPGTDPERRASVVTHYEIALEPKRFRERLIGFEDALVALDPLMRHRVRVLVGHQMAEWLAIEGPFRTMIVRVLMLPSSVRVEISADPEIARQSFWDSVVTPHVEDVVSTWGLDRRRESGALFELDSAGR